MAGQYGEFVINLRRNNLNTAWGFRLQGGKEFNTYLSIQRVFNGSPSDGHLQRGDVIVAVDNEDVSHWHQKQAYDLIQTIGLTLAIVVRRGGSDTDARPAPPSQAQPVESFVRKPFGQQQPQPQQQQQQAQSHHPQYAQQQQHQHQQQQQLSPQMTSKATLNFQSAPPSQPYAPPPSSHLSTDRENIGPSSSSSSGVAPWTQQHSPTPNQNSFSTPFQVRSVQPPPQKAYSSYSPQQSDSYAPGNAQSYAGSQGASQAPYQQDQSGGRAPFGRDSYQRDAAQTSQQPSYNEESNHVTYDRNQSAGAGSAQESRNEPAYNEGRKEEGGEEEDYQALSVRDIKQMFNKPDQKGAGPVSRIKRSPVAWTRPVDTASSAYGGVAPGPRPGQHSSLSPIRPGSIQRCPAVSDDFRKSYSPPAQPNYGQPRFASPPGVGKPTATVNVNKQGGAYAGIIQPSLPPKTTPAAAKPGQKGPQKKKDFDPNQSAVYKILLEEEERAKNQPHQQEEEEEEAPRRQAQGQKQGQRGKAQPQQGQRQPQKQQQGSRLDELLERDMAQLAPYKQEQSQHQEQRAPYQEQRSPYQEPRAPHQEQRSAYQEPRAPYQEQRSAYEEPKAPYQEQRSAYEEPKAPYQEQRSPYQEPRAPYQEQRSPYQEPRAPTYQEPGYSQPHRNEVHQPRSPARGGASGGWQPPSGPYGSQDYGSASFPQTQLVDGIPTSDF